MKIQVYGTGCATCKHLYESTKTAVSELGIQAEVEYITDIQKMVEKGFMQSPVLVVNNQIASIGSAPGIEKIKELLCDTNSKDSKNSESKKSCTCGGNC